MKIIDTKKVEGCLEGTNVRDIKFDRPIDKSFIERLGAFGKLIYADKIDKPFFKLIVRGKYTLKGTQGKTTIRAILPEDAGDETLEEIRELFLKQV